MAIHANQLRNATKSAWNRLADAIAFPTQSSVNRDETNSNHSYIKNLRDYIESEFRAANVSENDFHIVEIENPQPITGKLQKTLLVRLGPAAPGGLMFCGHSDV